MELVYLEDAYVKELETIITSIDPELSAVQFEKSIIYPGGGGQAKDHAVIEIGGRTFDLKDCKKDDRGIWYVLDAMISTCRMLPLSGLTGSAATTSCGLTLPCIFSVVLSGTSIKKKLPEGTWNRSKPGWTLNLRV